MIPWAQRSIEVQSLLNPSFCSVLLWKSALAYQREEGNLKLPFELGFLVLPMTLHRETRETIPRSIRTSLAVWVAHEPLIRATIADRAKTMVPFTREAILFASSHGLVTLSNGLLDANTNWSRKVAQGISDCSNEVKECIKGAEFLGRWFASVGSPETVMATIGICP